MRSLLLMTVACLRATAGAAQTVDMTGGGCSGAPVAARSGSSVRTAYR